MKSTNKSFYHDIKELLQNIKNMRQFYLIYQKCQTGTSQFKLNWSHYIFLTRIENIDERNFMK